MDDRRFDGFVRQLGGGRSRRSALGLIGGALAGALAARPNGDAEAACRATRKRGQACRKTCQCKGDASCERGFMTDQKVCCGPARATCRTNPDCCPGLLCNANGRCATPDLLP